MRVIATAGLGSLILIKSLPSDAATTGTIGLRGVVLAQAMVRVAAATIAAPMTIAFSSKAGAPMVLRLSGLANSAGGFVVSLGADDAGSSEPMLHAEDGTAVAYNVNFGGRQIDFTNGEAQLASISRDSPADDGQPLEIVPRSAFAAGKRYLDHLILTVKAR